MGRVSDLHIEMMETALVDTDDGKVACTKCGQTFDSEEDAIGADEGCRDWDCPLRK